MKKLFTLIAVAMMAIGAQAQTTINLGGLSASSFTYDATFYSESTWSSEDGASTAPAFTYLGGGAYSALQLTGQPFQFNYKNSGEKTNFFILNENYVTVGGKGAQVILTGITSGQKITLNVAAKASDSAPEFAASGAQQVGDTPDLSKAHDFQQLVFQATQDGEVKITESAKGFCIESVVIEDGGDLPVAEITEYIICYPVKSTANKVYEGYTEGTSENYAEFDNGCSVAIMRSDKGMSSGSSITIDNKKYTSIKVSNGAANIVTLPEGKLATKATFYSYVNKDAATDRTPFWKEVNGTTYDADIDEGGMLSFKDGNNPDVREFILPKVNSFTFTNTGEQLCYVLVIDLRDDVYVGINNVQAIELGNDAIYNLAGQKVSAAYKGVVVKNGKKVMQ